MKRLTLCLLLAGCAHRPALVWTEVGLQPYDHRPLPIAQARYEDEARKSMGISRAEWDAAKNRQAWEAKHPRFAPPGSCRDTSLERALARP